MNRLRVLLLLSLPALAQPGCSGGRVEPGEVMAVAPLLSVERFLQAANARDVTAMARLFGTAEGPVIEAAGGPASCFFRAVGAVVGLGERCLSRLEIERRMLAMALLLRHDDYEVVSEERVPARAHPTVRVGVTLVRGGARYPDIPFLVVRTEGGSWLVQEIGLERITRGPAVPPGS